MKGQKNVQEDSIEEEKKVETMKMWQEAKEGVHIIGEKKERMTYI